MNYKLVLTLTLAGLAVLFIIQNVAVVEIQFLFWSTQMPRSLLMFLLLAIGIIMGWFSHGYYTYKIEALDKKAEIDNDSLLSR